MRVTIWDIDLREMPRWFHGDVYFRRIARRAADHYRVRRTSGLPKVRTNLLRGLMKIGVDVDLVTTIQAPPRKGAWGVLNGPLPLLRGPLARRPVITGPGVLTWPIEWPGVFSETKVSKHLVGSDWYADFFRSHYSGPIEVWPVGIDTDKFVPAWPDSPYSVIVYDKISMYSEKVPEVKGLLQTILAALKKTGVCYHLLTYGSYHEHDFVAALRKAHGCVFLSQHETQGIAMLEAMSANVPVLAWNPGRVLEKNWEKTAKSWPITATSVPYFDERCGVVFDDPNHFEEKLAQFRAACEAGDYRPREFILENLTLEQTAHKYLKNLRET